MLNPPDSMLSAGRVYVPGSSTVGGSSVVPIDNGKTLPKSGTSKLLSQRLIEYDEARGLVRVEFEAPLEVLNPAGFVQGGILATMLDDTMGPAVWLKTKGDLYPITIDLSVSFLAAARQGKFLGEGAASFNSERPSPSLKQN
jgi:hypothetical protein